MITRIGIELRPIAAAPITTAQARADAESPDWQSVPFRGGWLPSAHCVAGAVKACENMSMTASRGTQYSACCCSARPRHARHDGQRIVRHVSWRPFRHSSFESGLHDARKQGTPVLYSTSMSTEYSYAFECLASATADARPEAASPASPSTKRGAGAGMLQATATGRPARHALP